jgi:hypothetical protein
MPDGSLVRISASSQYRASPTRRLRAFLFTDRIGQTIASLLGLTKLLRWWLRGRLRRLAWLVPSSRSHDDSGTPGAR